MKNNTPHYLIINFHQAQDEQKMPDEDVMELSLRILKNNMVAYSELAK